MNRWLILILILSQAVFAALELQTLPVQDGGRIKPYDTFARESLQLLTGRSTYQGQAAWEIVLTWVLHPQAWLDRPIIEVGNADLKKAMKLDVEEKLFAPKEVFENERMSLVMQELASFRQGGDKLTPYYQAVQRLESQYFTFNQIVSGRLLKLVPAKNSQNWVALNEVGQEYRDAFVGITKAFLARIEAVTKNDKERLVTANAEFDRTVIQFRELIGETAEAEYPYATQMKLELHYNNFHPFRWAWVFYLLGAIGFLMALGSIRFSEGAGWLMTFLGFAFHCYGFALRVFLSGRPPVSNMYETVIWVPFGAILFGFIIWLSYRSRALMVIANVMSVLCMILADMAPAILDPTIQPLEPVLRSSFWLITHVMVITLAYSAFLLAFGLGLVGLFFYIQDEKKHPKSIRRFFDLIYRSIQIGVVLLAAGTILGGVWADYSWGRFWGWDPKETWALIALLGYLALLHGRLSGWLKEFGMMVGAVVCFSLVVMAWYGVNFVLGAGLHSYGFGAGGVEIVAGVVFVVLAYVAFAITVRQSRLKSKG